MIIIDIGFFVAVVLPLKDGVAFGAIGFVAGTFVLLAGVLLGV